MINDSHWKNEVKAQVSIVLIPKSLFTFQIVSNYLIFIYLIKFPFFYYKPFFVSCNKSVTASVFQL